MTTVSKPNLIDILSFSESTNVSEFEETVINATVKVLAYYDNWEKEYGDGFYPIWAAEDKNLCHWDKTFVYFTLVDEFVIEQCKNCFIWKQTTEKCIDGLDYDTGKELLETLNNFLLDKYKNNTICEKILGTVIQNKCGEMIYPPKNFKY